MKKNLLILGMLVFTVSVHAGDMPEGWTPPKPSAELQKIASLEGTSAGINTHKPGENKLMTVTYKPTSGGTAVVETIDSGTSHEMVSVYRDKAGKLLMTHYCMLGNQPELEVKSAGEGTMVLGTSPESHEALKNEMHMSGLTLEWLPDGQLNQS